MITIITMILWELLAAIQEHWTEKIHLDELNMGVFLYVAIFVFSIVMGIKWDILLYKKLKNNSQSKS